jgi:hypothetical protein
MARRAKDLGFTADATRFSDIAEEAAATFQKKFYNSTAKTYDEPGRETYCRQYLSPQTTISLADELGVIPVEDRCVSPPRVFPSVTLMHVCCLGD